jgi:hypothetical protein
VDSLARGEGDAVGGGEGVAVGDGAPDALPRKPLVVAEGPVAVPDSPPLREAAALALKRGDAEARALRLSEAERAGEALPRALSEGDREGALERDAEALRLPPPTEGEGGAVCEGTAVRMAEAEALPEGVASGDEAGGALSVGGAVSDTGCEARAVAVPPAAATVVVPERIAPAGPLSIAAVTLPVKATLKFPYWSRARTARRTAKVSVVAGRGGERAREIGT